MPGEAERGDHMDVLRGLLEGLGDLLETSSTADKTRPWNTQVHRGVPGGDAEIACASGPPLLFSGGR